ncbi:MAG: 2-hydroxychromene-2-carboxylate isomerase [Hydrogenophaga sp.]|jgi:2-hydroxychromene-2-carboxylate isomerase|uniref:2-hydroxychromene-2-carboxylate isomerase n=1 Tax=Hydrogenophaga sp. TaxID=1904254 RepID=UPI002621B8EA|nr:2-hydroxychromene-2-carboxylate isomerase [Hydrogenophaga sp.]MCV0440111.1 2-hydroxychromene-2-carboxylate isomerase [Hydrogenophaga sp.]
MAAPLHFYFDFISPYGYFASLRIEDLAARHGRGVAWHPMLLGVSVMKVMGLKPLMETPLKGPYTERDVLRHAREHGIALQRHPMDTVMNPLPCARAMAWVNRHQPQRAAEVAHALYAAYWGQGLDLSTAGSLLPLVGATIAEAAASDEAAALLRSEVDAALQAGVFGSPTVVVDGELFWGVDKLDQLERWLTRGGW